MKSTSLHLSTSTRLKPLRTLSLCVSALIIRGTFAASTPTVPTLSELAASLAEMRESASANSQSLAEYRAENTQLLEEMAAMSQRLAVASNAIALVERRCETDAAWRAAYHQGLAAQAVCTNEFGIIYRVDVFNDGYVYADYTSHTPESPDPEAEERQKALIAAKREEAQAAMERARLPERVAALLAARRAAAATNEVTVTITPNN